MAKKLRLNILLREEVVESVRASGIRNLSHYVEQLIKADLASMGHYETAEKDELARLNKELEYWAKEWEALEKKRTAERGEIAALPAVSTSKTVKEQRRV